MAYSVKKSLQSIDGVYIYNINDYEKNVRTRSVIQALHHDIKKGGTQFELFYQPVVYSMNTSKEYLWEISAFFKV
ncbi:hypothetical protein AB4453_19200, partial [Vibrio atlanticus]